MDISGKNLWQIAAGDTNRNYVDICIEWDVVLNGPGDAGELPTCIDLLRSDWGLTEKKLTDLKRFHEKVKDRDIVVLRLGTTDVMAVGIVVGSYEWHDAFGDIDGWDLQHIRRVRWVWKYSESNAHKPKRFDTYAMKLGDTTQLLNPGDVMNWVAGLTIDSNTLSRPLCKLPPAGVNYKTDIDAISEHLFSSGVSSSAIKSLENEIGELERIADWYHRSGGPSEAETIAYLIMPVLKLLNWTPQKMAIEWNNVDLALFNRLPRKNDNLCAVVEAKLKGSACLSAKSQAQTYAEQPGRDKCKRLIVTDGIRYGVYIRGDQGFSHHPAAYLNLLDLKREYPILHCKGAADALLMMSADWSP